MSATMRPQSHEGQTASQPRLKINASSAMLTPEENESVFKLLGRKCQTLNTAVVQIYKTEGSAHSHWKKKHTGVICFVKDNTKRSYFLRAYCLIKNELIWEHELYESMEISMAKRFLLTFEGQDGHVGLNFVSEDECESFYRVVDTTIQTRKRKKLERRNRLKPQNAPSAPNSAIATSNAPPLPPNHPSERSATDSSSVQLRNHTKIHTVNLTPAPPQPAPANKNFLTGGFLSSSSSSKDKKRKINKTEIGRPTNFVHVSHVGWDAQKGFDLAGNEHDEVLSSFFAKAGVSENQLQDRETRQFIYDFIQSNNVVETMKSERVDKPEAPAPPPVPSRQHHIQNGSTPVTQRAAPPPPPPSRQPPPPVPTTAPGGGGVARAPPPPTRPPPISGVPLPPVAPPTAAAVAPAVAPPPPPPPPPMSGVPPPPPPPPPMAGVPIITTTHAPSSEAKPASVASQLPVVNDARSALMDSIRKGTILKKVDTAALSTGSGDSRSDLMTEIRQGIELRPASTRELGANRSSDDGAGTDALALALRRALLERGRVIQSSDDESASSGNDDEWDD